MQKTYTAYFYTDAEYASTDIEASNPQEALEKAKAINELRDGDGLIFDHYDEGQPVKHIEILDDDRNELAHWRDDDMLLRTAGLELLEALRYCDMTLADLEASKRKGYVAQAKKLARSALAKVTPAAVNQALETLSPDPEKGNDDRAASAGAALRHFQCITGADHEDALGDFLCDLMLWCARNNCDFDLALTRAQGHYQAETARG